MSRNEMGSHSRSRADVITRSTARRCEAIVSSRHSFLIASVSCIFPQRFSQLSGHGNRHHLLALALHARDLLLAARNQLFAAPVFEVHCDAVLCQLTKAHAQGDLVEGEELRHKLTRHPCGYQDETV